MMLKITKIISSDSKANPEDVIGMKRTLMEHGYYTKPEYGLTVYPDAALFDGIKRLQKDNKLKVDGRVKPTGETLRLLNSLDVPDVQSPRIKCPVCGAWHGGVFSDVCSDCILK